MELSNNYWKACTARYIYQETVTLKMNGENSL